MKIIDDDLLEKFRAKWRCEWCKKLMPSGCDPHHLFARGLGGGGRLDHPWNILALCRECHNDVHNGKITRSDLLAIVAARENTTQGEIEKKIWELRRMRGTVTISEREEAR